MARAKPKLGSAVRVAYPAHTILLTSYSHALIPRAVEAVGSRSGATTAPVRIAACGQLEALQPVEESRATSVS